MFPHVTGLVGWAVPVSAWPDPVTPESQRLQVVVILAQLELV